MKIIYANLMFQLPDDFAGTYYDGLRVYADYAEKVAKANDGKTPNYAESDGTTATAEEQEILDSAMEIMQRLFDKAQKHGRRLANSCALAEWNEGESDWTYYDYDGKKETGVKE